MQILTNASTKIIAGTAISLATSGATSGFFVRKEEEQDKNFNFPKVNFAINTLVTSGILIALGFSTPSIALSLGVSNLIGLFNLQRSTVTAATVTQQPRGDENETPQAAAQTGTVEGAGTPKQQQQ